MRYLVIYQSIPESLFVYSFELDESDPLAALLEACHNKFVNRDQLRDRAFLADFPELFKASLVYDDTAGGPVQEIGGERLIVTGIYL